MLILTSIVLITLTPYPASVTNYLTVNPCITLKSLLPTYCASFLVVFRRKIRVALLPCVFIIAVTLVSIRYIPLLHKTAFTYQIPCIFRHIPYSYIGRLFVEQEPSN